MGTWVNGLRSAEIVAREDKNRTSRRRWPTHIPFLHTAVSAVLSDTGDPALTWRGQ